LNAKIKELGIAARGGRLPEESPLLKGRSWRGGFRILNIRARRGLLQSTDAKRYHANRWGCRRFFRSVRGGLPAAARTQLRSGIQPDGRESRFCWRIPVLVLAALRPKMGD